MFIPNNEHLTKYLEGSFTTGASEELLRPYENDELGKFF